MTIQNVPWILFFQNTYNTDDTDMTVVSQLHRKLISPFIKVFKHSSGKVWRLWWLAAVFSVSCHASKCDSFVLRVLCFYFKYSSNWFIVISFFWVPLQTGSEITSLFLCDYCIIFLDKIMVSLSTWQARNHKILRNFTPVESKWLSRHLFAC